MEALLLSRLFHFSQRIQMTRRPQIKVTIGHRRGFGKETVAFSPFFSFSQKNKDASSPEKKGTLCPPPVSRGSFHSVDFVQAAQTCHPCRQQSPRLFWTSHRACH